MQTSIPMQESLLIVLCFTKDAEKARHLLGESTYFSGRREVLADKVFAFIDEHHEPPRKHIVELLDDELAKDSTKDKYIDLINRLFELQDQVNVLFTLSQLGRFKRTQAMQTGMLEAAQALKAKEEGGYERAEEILRHIFTEVPQDFDGGRLLGEATLAGLAEEGARDLIDVNIDELDRRRLQPARGTMHVLVTAPNRGKSWWLVHVGTEALEHIDAGTGRGKTKVLHLTLEMSDKSVLNRYCQRILGAAMDKTPTSYTTMTPQPDGGLTLSCDVSPPTTLYCDPRQQKQLEKEFREIGQQHYFNNLIVKQFPTGSLTIDELRHHLENLDRMQGFVPDVVLLDYVDLMKMDKQNYRIALGVLYQELRGLAIERNFALVTASQANRKGSQSVTIGSEHISEDWSKIMTADVVITYSQTPAEYEYGLARLTVEKSRNSAAHDTFLISQHYATGQFCLDCHRLPTTYDWHNPIPQASGAAVRAV